MFSDYKFWRNKKVLITGHTGFKGSWLSLLLNEFGAELFGYSLKPEKNFLFHKAKISKLFKKSIYANLLDKKKLNNAINKIKPNIIFHLAAEPLVIDSYKNPEKTFKVNFIGTLNLFEAIKESKHSIKTVIVITTDKVYKILKNNPNYNENHCLGATDPYGTSKACVELLTETYFHSFFKKKNINIFTARAGNVIGGGDFSNYRIVPDYIRALNQNKKLLIRNPEHIRPWQYVLEPLYGYTLLVKKNYHSLKKFSAWNFAPFSQNAVNVKKLIEIFQNSKNLSKKINLKFLKNSKKIKETQTLKLDSNKSQKLLKWKLKYDLKKTVYSILEWNNEIKKNDFFYVSVNTVKKFIKQI